MQPQSPTRPLTPARVLRPALPGLLGALACLVAAGATAEPPASIVSVGGSVTEVLYELGLQDRIVAVDSTSLYPLEAQSLPNVGYVRALAAEPIIAMKAELVLAEADAGPPAVLQQMRDAGLAVQMIPDEASPEGVAAKIRAVAAATDSAERGESLALATDSAFAALAERRAGLAEQPKVLFLLSHSGTPLAAGRGTSADAVIALAGGQNAASGFEGYKPLSPEMAVTLEPDVLVLTDQGVAALGGLERVKDDPALALLPAVEAGRVYSFDALLLLGFGPRTPEVAADLMAKMHAPAATAAD